MRWRTLSIFWWGETRHFFQKNEHEMSKKIVIDFFVERMLLMRRYLLHERTFSHWTIWSFHS